jgi:hypothetical protein
MSLFKHFNMISLSFLSNLLNSYSYHDSNYFKTSACSNINMIFSKIRLFLWKANKISSFIFTN